MKSLPEVLNTIETNLKTMEHEELNLHRAQAALKKKRNSYISPISALPFELLAWIFKIAVAPVSPYRSSNEYDERKLAQVCSRWRQIALEVCPVWNRVSLTFESYKTAEIRLHDTRGRHIKMPVYRQPGVDNALYIQTVIDTISPYIKQLDSIDLVADDAGQLQPFLEFWLAKGAPGSLTQLSLSAGGAPVGFPETNSRLNDRLCRFVRRVEALTLYSVVLDWSSIMFDRLTSMRLADLPSVCSPSLVQLARILSTCPNLRTLWLQRIAISASLGAVALEPVELKHLKSITLDEVDVASVFSIISTGCELYLKLRGVAGDSNMVASLCLFAGRVDIRKLTLTLSETRSDEALAQLLHSTISLLPDLESLKLEDMNLRDSELNALASHPPAQNNYFLPSALVDTADGFTQIGNLELQFCTIHTTAGTFHNAVSAFPWRRLMLTECNHCPVAEGNSDGVTEVLEPIDTQSEFGIRLKKLRPGRVSIYNV